jgi:hypothetical protein
MQNLHWLAPVQLGYRYREQFWRRRYAACLPEFLVHDFDRRELHILACREVPVFYIATDYVCSWLDTDGTESARRLG